ncbi:MAG TPA: hypothetical protein VFB38_02505 [Chthonomonadaceae bacterium]|nr:hypothetical protein [Chthonomonadaceae bacterium]
MNEGIEPERKVPGQVVTYETRLEKFNEWCHRRPLVSVDEDRRRRAYTCASKSGLSKVEKAAFYLHELTGCDGLEFVAFSNARLNKPVTLTGDVVLMPCFLPEIEGSTLGDPLVDATSRMATAARYIYDGWVPILKWDTETVRQTVRNVGEALSLLALYGRTHFDWEPKYPFFKEPSSSFKVADAHLSDLETIAKLLEPLHEKDRVAIYRSLAWLSQGIRLNEPEPHFLCCILAIESLATYIEKQDDATSPLANLRTGTLSEIEKRAECERCIRDTLAKFLDKDAEEAIKRAYFDCVVSITQRLKRHLASVFAPDKEPVEIFYKKVKRKHLYDLRSHIGHGTADPLDKLAREQIANRVWDAEKIARLYIIRVLQKALGAPALGQLITASASLPLQNAIFSSENMYKGPTHMAFIYC